MVHIEYALVLIGKSSLAECFTINVSDHYSHVIEFNNTLIWYSIIKPFYCITQMWTNVLKTPTTAQRWQCVKTRRGRTGADVPRDTSWMDSLVKVGRIDVIVSQVDLLVWHSL